MPHQKIGEMAQAQPNSLHRYTASPKMSSPRQRHWDSHRPHNTTIEQLLRASDVSPWSAPSSPVSSPRVFRKDHDSDHDFGHHHKKSVLAKVRDKAKKWRHNLGKKHHSDENMTPSCGVISFDEECEEAEEDAEFLGAPMYESELAPEYYQENARQHPRAMPVISEKHMLPGNVSHLKNPADDAAADKTITETVAEKLAPAYATVADATNAIASKLQGLTITPHQAPEIVEHASEIQQWDKGVSVKQYLMHKLQPGEDERALSQVISEVMSPRRSHGDGGVVEMMKEAVTSFLRSESSSPNSHSPTKVPSPSASEHSPTKAPSPSASAHSPIKASSPSASAHSPIKASSPSASAHSPTKASSSADAHSLAKAFSSADAYSPAKAFSSADSHSLAKAFSSADALPATKASSSASVHSPRKMSPYAYIHSPRKESLATYANSPIKSSSPAFVYSPRKKPLSANAQSSTSSSSPFSISTNAYEAVEEENRGRILQPN